MDYAEANLIHGEEQREQIIQSNIAVEKDGTYKGEKHRFLKEQQQLQNYFNEIADRIKGYDRILLFGPSKAKTVFRHFLEQERNFEKVTVEEATVDQLTDNEKKAFVRKHFMD